MDEENLQVLVVAPLPSVAEGILPCFPGRPLSPLWHRSNTNSSLEDAGSELTSYTLHSVSVLHSGSSPNPLTAVGTASAGGQAAYDEIQLARLIHARFIAPSGRRSLSARKMSSRRTLNSSEMTTTMETAGSIPPNAGLPLCDSAGLYSPPSWPDGSGLDGLSSQAQGSLHPAELRNPDQPSEATWLKLDCTSQLAKEVETQQPRPWGSSNEEHPLDQQNSTVLPTPRQPLPAWPPTSPCSSHAAPAARAPGPSLPQPQPESFLLPPQRSSPPLHPHPHPQSHPHPHQEHQQLPPAQQDDHLMAAFTIQQLHQHQHQQLQQPTYPHLQQLAATEGSAAGTCTVASTADLSRPFTAGSAAGRPTPISKFSTQAADGSPSTAAATAIIMAATGTATNTTSSETRSSRNSSVSTLRASEARSSRSSRGSVFSHTSRASGDHRLSRAAHDSTGGGRSGASSNLGPNTHLHVSAANNVVDGGSSSRLWKREAADGGAGGSNGGGGASGELSTGDGASRSSLWERRMGTSASSQGVPRLGLRGSGGSSGVTPASLRGGGPGTGAVVLSKSSSASGTGLGAASPSAAAALAAAAAAAAAFSGGRRAPPSAGGRWLMMTGDSGGRPMRSLSDAVQSAARSPCGSNAQSAASSPIASPALSRRRHSEKPGSLMTPGAASAEASPVDGSTAATGTTSTTAAVPTGAFCEISPIVPAAETPPGRGEPGSSYSRSGSDSAHKSIRGLSRSQTTGIEPGSCHAPRGSEAVAQAAASSSSPLTALDTPMAGAPASALMAASSDLIRQGSRSSISSTGNAHRAASGGGGASDGSGEISLGRVRGHSGRAARSQTAQLASAAAGDAASAPVAMAAPSVAHQASTPDAPQSAAGSSPLLPLFGRGSLGFGSLSLPFFRPSAPAGTGSSAPSTPTAAASHSSSGLSASPSLSTAGASPSSAGQEPQALRLISCTVRASDIKRSPGARSGRVLTPEELSRRLLAEAGGAATKVLLTRAAGGNADLPPPASKSGRGFFPPIAEDDGTGATDGAASTGEVRRVSPGRGPSEPSCGCVVM